MLSTTTTTEHQSLVVAAPIGHRPSLGAGVAATRYRAPGSAMCATANPAPADDRRHVPASTFGDWKLPRRLVGFVT